MRMEKIVEAKLACLPQEEPVTTLTFLSLYNSLLKTTLIPALQPDLLILSCKLETIFCDSNYAAFPSSLLALALLFTEVKSIQNSEQQHLVRSLLIEIQQLIQVMSKHNCIFVLIQQCRLFTDLLSRIRLAMFSYTNV